MALCAFNFLLITAVELNDLTFLQLRRSDLFIDAESGKIISGQAHFFSTRKDVDQTIDLQGNIIAPGYIDAQINGAYGVDFSRIDEGDAAYLKGLNEVSRRIVETGTTSYVPTIITQRKELYQKVSSAWLFLSRPKLT